MRKTAWLTAAFLVCVGAGGCSENAPPPGLSLSASGPQGPIAAPFAIGSSVLVTAAVVHGQGEVAWTLSGSCAAASPPQCSLSGQTGLSVTLRLPTAVAAGATATVTATMGADTAAITFTLAPQAAAPAKIANLGRPVTVSTDLYGIPHLRCATALDCWAGQGYVQAKDRFFQMDVLRHTAEGRLTELVGAELGGKRNNILKQDVLLRQVFTTRDGQRIQDALFANAGPAAQAALSAYANGVNAYLAELRAGAQKMPGEYAQLPFPIAAAALDPWTPQDTFSIARLQQFQLSESLAEETDDGRFAQIFGPGAPLGDPFGAKLFAYLRAAQPSQVRSYTLPPAGLHAPIRGAKEAPAPLGPVGSFSPALRQASAGLSALRSSIRPLGADFGSNSWAVGAGSSATGKAMLASDPHLALQYPPFFHLATLTSDDPADNLDVAGGGFPGIPGALIGRGKNVSFGNTLVGYDVTDLYQETLTVCGALPAGYPANTPCVSFRGAAVPALRVAATFKVRTAAGLVDAATQPLAAPDLPAELWVVPHHGPIVALDRPGGDAVSVRWTGQEPYTQDLSAILGVNVAPDVAHAVAALRGFAVGAQNWLLADDAGTIAFDPHALVPQRRFIDPTNPRSWPWFPLDGRGAFEWGSGTSTDFCDGWDRTGAAPKIAQPKAACWIADADLPQGAAKSSGFYASSNADPIGVSDDNHPEQKPLYFSFDWDSNDPTGLRHQRVTQLLNAALASGGKVSLDDMTRIQADHKSTLGAIFAGILAGPAYDAAAAASPDFKTARDAFSTWTAEGNDCPTGLLTTDPKGPVDPDAKNTRSSAACFLFHAFARTLLQNVFADEIAAANHLGNLAPDEELAVSWQLAVKSLLYMLEQPTSSPVYALTTSYCNDVSVTGTVLHAKSCPDQLVAAAVTAVRLVSAQQGSYPADWRWGRVHTAQPVSYIPTVTAGYSPGPYARPGGAFTVDAARPSITQAGLTDFSFTDGANLRYVSIMDGAAPTFRMQLPGPERDQAAGMIVGPDLLAGWAQNQYFDFPYRAQIAAVTVAVQTLVAP